MAKKSKKKTTKAGKKKTATKKRVTASKPKVVKAEKKKDLDIKVKGKTSKDKELASKNKVLTSKKKLTTSKKQNLNFNNEELLEQIMAKKRAKKEAKKAVQANKKTDIKYKKKPLKKIKKEEISRKKSKYLIILMIFIVIISLIVGSLLIFKKKDPINNMPEKEEVIDLRPQLYEECLNQELNEKDTSEEIQSYITELNDYLKKNYKLSVQYEDLTFGYKYEYNKQTVYYAASTVKLLDALYIYTKASEGELNLDTTLKYTAKYRRGASKEMAKYKYGSKVSLKNLVKYAVTVSDNTAHYMLYDYIGRTKLKEFGKQLGATKTLVGDMFGSINTNDGIAYLKALNDFINNNEELGLELKQYFLDAEQNALKIDEYNILAAHKYGEYSSYYHDIGIVYDEHPYAIAILTLEGKKNYEKKISDVNKRIYELHNMYYENRKNYCYTEIYETES